MENYFATRCSDGDVGIYSSSADPDIVYLFENVDQAEEQGTHMADTQRESTTIQNEEPKKDEEEDVPEEDPEGDNEEGDGEEEELDEDGNPINKKPPKIIEPPKKDKSGRISSKHDQMIELEP